MLNGVSCEECPSGYYAPTAQVDTCLECRAGDHTSVASKATTCSSCDSGTYSEGFAVNCTVCAAGTASNSRASECYDCDAGKWSDDGAASCTKCGAGKFQNATGQTSCHVCPRGRAQPDTGEDDCDPCEEGEFMGDKGETACLRCSTERGKGYWSSEGATECDQAAEGYFMNTQTKEPEECSMEGIECDEVGLTPETMVIDKGFYRFSASATMVYRCMANCEGSSSSLSDSSDSSNSSDRRRRRLTYYETDTKCKSGSEGPLCSLCDTDHYLDSSKGKCRNCQTDWLVPLLGLLACTVLCAVLVLSRARLVRWAARNKSWLPSFGEKLVIFITTMQIIFMLKLNHTSG